MGDSQQDVQKRIGYEHWTKEESKVLLELMTDGASHGWRNNSTVFSKKIVTERILPVLNSQLGCNKNYHNYQSRLKWFRKRWLYYSTLLDFSPDFKFDSNTKRFTAPNEVWDEYLKAHPKDGNLRYGVFDDYEDLRIAVGSDVPTGKYLVETHNVTGSRTLEVGEGRDLAELDYDNDNEGFEEPEQNYPPPMVSLEVFELPKTQLPSKRSRDEYEESSNLGGKSLKTSIMEQIKRTLEDMHALMKKREEERAYTVWDAIKEIPDLDEDMRINVLNLFDPAAIKEGFLKMTLEERKKWISNKMPK